MLLCVMDIDLALCKRNLSVILTDVTAEMSLSSESAPWPVPTISRIPQEMS